MPACEFSFCIYQKEGSCILSSTHINSIGICDDAITIDLPEAELSQRKEELLAEFKRRKDAWKSKEP